MAAKGNEKPLWRIGWASKSRKRPNQGTSSVRDLVSAHTFGWEKRTKALVVVDHLGGANWRHHRLPLPIKLAEAFFLRCLEREFRERFLLDPLPLEEAEEKIEVAEVRLAIRRTKAEPWRNGLYIMPDLHLTLENGEARHRQITLFDDLRLSFGTAMAKLAPEEVKRHLRGE